MITPEIRFTDAKKLREKSEKLLNGNHLNGSHLNGNHLNGNHLNGNHLNGSQLNGNQLTEKQLIEKQNFENNTLMETLLHELQVQQLTLEMQNEELRQAYEIAETARKKYTMLFDQSPLGCFSLDADGTICDINYRGADLLGKKRKRLINCDFKFFVSHDSKLVFSNFFRKIYNGYAKESCEISLGYNSEPLHRVYMEGVVSDDEQQCLISVVEIVKF